MTGRIAIFSAGVWRLRDEISDITGLTPQRVWWRTGNDAAAIAGWGHKPTAARARAEATRTGLPYIGFEDGFLRSLRAGPAELPAALIADRTGIYYDARHPSDLETLIESGVVTEPDCARADALLAAIARHRLSKYNDGPDELAGALPQTARELVLVVDQTAGDASVSGGLASAESFAAMLAAAVSENPNALVVAKLHPETVNGTKRGYLAELPLPPGVVRLASKLNPWALIGRRPTVYTVSSQLGFEALMAGCRVVCFGAPFYAGWGLTDDRIAVPRRSARPSRADLAAAVYLHYCHYFDLWRRTPVSAETAVDQLAFGRAQFFRNSRPVVGYRIARWKRRAVAAMLDGPQGPPVFVNSRAEARALAGKNNLVIAAWGREALALREETPGLASLAVEDGFIRSAGLGAAFVSPLSLVFDTRGLYFDPRTASDLEHLLATGEFDAAKLAAAQALHRRLLAERVTKYNLAGAAQGVTLPTDRIRILVPGQVADDWAIRLAFPGAARGENVNAVLLAAVRRRNPQAFIMFKPHPDVERLGRAGRLSPQEEAQADLVLRHASMDQALAMADRVETFGSLAGFEALLRGKPVTTHGQPFYAGWGLTEDVSPLLRRTRTRTLDELVAATLIDYPRYWDPVSGLACPPDVVLDRLAAMRTEPPSIRRRMASAAGRAVIVWRRLRAKLAG